MSNSKTPTFLIVDPDVFSRNLLADALHTAGYFALHYACSCAELLARTAEFRPRVIFATSRIAEASRLEFARMIRAGFTDVSRQTSNVIMTAPHKGVP